MAFRSLGVKVMNNAKIIANNESNISQHIIASDENSNKEKYIAYKGIEENIPSIKRMNSRKRKRRQRMHFRPVIPEHYICPITQELMSDPVIISSGHTFERAAIIEWFDDGNTLNPLTGQKLENVDIKPNYALKEAIKDYRRKLADELFRITFDSNKNEHVLHYQDNILFPNESDHEQDEKMNINDHHNEYDGYITDDEEEGDIESDTSIKSNVKSTKKKKRKNYKLQNQRNPNIPIIAFMGPNNTGKSTLLNLIVGEPVFCIDEFDALSKVVRFKIVTRSDREFILLDVEGLFAENGCGQIEDDVLKVFFAVYSIASVIVWNDINENNPILKELLTRADTRLHTLNGDGSHFCPYDNNIDAQSDIYSDTPSGQLLPEELKQFLLKKYKKQSAKRENRRSGVNIGKMYTHKPAFIVLRRDFESEAATQSTLLHSGNFSDYDDATPKIRPRTSSSSPWLSSDSEYTYTKNNSPKSFSLASPTRSKKFNFSGDSSDFLSSPRLTSVQREKYQILNKRQSPSLQSLSSAQYTAANIIAPSTSGNESATSTQNVQNNTSLSIVDELTAHNEIDNDKLPETNAMIGSNFSDSSVVMGNVLNNCIIFGKKEKQKKNSNSILFSEYVKKHDDFTWLRQLNLFSFVDGVILHKLNCDDEDDDNMYQDDSLLSVLPKLEKWIHEWFENTQNVVPIVRNDRDMQSVVKMINKHNTLSPTKYVEEIMKIKGSRLEKYFYYDQKERTLNALKVMAERFKWDNKELIRWFIKHFNRLWYFTKDFPNAHDALLYQSLFYQFYLNEDNKAIVPSIILNLSHFYYQISHKVDLYSDIVDKGTNWGQFAGAISGLGSLSLMSVIHPLVGIAAVPFSIRLCSNIGGKSGKKVGNIVANSKAHFVDQTERYDLGKIESDDGDDN